MTAGTGLLSGIQAPAGRQRALVDCYVCLASSQCKPTTALPGILLECGSLPGLPVCFCVWQPRQPAPSPWMRTLAQDYAFELSSLAHNCWERPAGQQTEQLTADRSERARGCVNRPAATHQAHLDDTAASPVAAMLLRAQLLHSSKLFCPAMPAPAVYAPHGLEKQPNMSKPVT